MKKFSTIFLILIVLVINFLIINNLLFSGINKSNLDRILSDFEIVNNSLNQYEIFNSGSLSSEVYYKGAHGERHPKNFNYSFIYKDSVLKIIDDDNYIQFTNNDPLIKMLRSIKLLTKEDFKIKNSSNKKLVLDESLINSKLNTNFSNIYITLEDRYINLFLDDIKIQKKDYEYLITSKDNIIYLSLSKTGYYVDINGLLKMNVFFKKNENVYSVVLDNFVFFVSISDNNIQFKSKSKIDMFNGMDITLRKDTVEDKDKLKESNDEFIIKRYFSGINSDYWRN